MMSAEQQNGNQPEAKVAQKKRVRSPYLFPAYDFSKACQIAERVEIDGAGSLSEETLAIALHLSAKSSGFQLKTLTSRQFGLLTKQDNILSTTPLAKAIFKPKSEDEKKKAMAESFLTIPFFRAMATRFKGQPLPSDQALRNIIEREFGIDSKRVSDAAGVLISSAREAGVLVISGSSTYLSTERVTVERKEAEEDIEPPGTPPIAPPVMPPKYEDALAKVPSNDELRRLYLKKLIEQVSPLDTSGKNAEAIKAEAELRKSELDRIERLIGITNKREDEQ